MTAAALIGESDWLRLGAALRHMDEVSLERTLGGDLRTDGHGTGQTGMAGVHGGGPAGGIPRREPTPVF